MENQVEEIKQKLDIVDIISRYITLKKRGRHFVANCPFHNEKSPSFIVSPELQIFKCFGCGKSGDIYTFVQEYDRVDFKEALQDLAKIAGITLVRSPEFSVQESHQKRLLALNLEISRFYSYILTSHPLGKPALDYVLNRGITLSIIKEFAIGFSPQNPALIVNYLVKKGFAPDELVSSGTFGHSTYRQNQLYDRFLGRLTFPLSDYRGRVLGFSGRILPFASRPDSAKYINSPETEIYHKSQLLFGLHLSKEHIKSANTAIITEGEFDMISPYQSGIKNIVALKGTAFTSQQLELLRRFTDTLILALDSDFAGNSAAKKSIELADKLEFDIKVLSLGDKYKDPDEAVKADLPFFQDQLKKAQPVWDFIIQSAVKNYGTDTDKGKKQVLSMVLPFLTQISNSVIRSDYYNKLSSQLGSKIEAVSQEAIKYQSPKAVLPPPPPANRADPTPAPAASPTEKFEQAVLILILGSKKPHLVAQKLKNHLSLLMVPRFKDIADKLISTDVFDPKTFQTQLRSEIQPTFQSLFLSATTQVMESYTRRREIKKAIAQIANIVLKQKLRYLSTKIAQIETDTESDELSRLEDKYNQILSRLSRFQSGKV